MDKEISSIINTAITSIKEGLWPIFCITALVIFRQQLRSLFDKLVFSQNLKVNAGPFAIEASDIKSPTQPIIEATENDKSDAPSSPESNDSPSIYWYEPVVSLLNDSKVDEAEALFEKFLRDNKSLINYEHEHAFFMYLHFTNTRNTDVLDKLIILIGQSKNSNIKSEYINAYIYCLETVNEFNKAIIFLEHELAETQEIKIKTKYTILLSKMHIANLNLDEAKIIMVRLINLLSKDKSDDFSNELHNAYLQLGEVENKKENQTDYALCLDKALQYQPANTKTLFSAAYEASQTSFLETLSLSDYSLLIELNPEDAATLNNLGVVAGKLNLKITSCDYYRAANKLNNTLAMANMGFQLLSAGCANEAEELATFAISQKDPNKNNHELLAKIYKERETEETKWTKAKKTSLEKQKFLRVSTEMRYNLDVSIPNHNDWIDNQNRPVAITIERDYINMTWTDSTRKINFYGSYENAALRGVYISAPDKEKQSLTLLASSDKTETYQCTGYFDPIKDCIQLISSDIEKDIKITLSKA
ncbi:MULTISPECIES: hypothetical protein [Klebsiella]|uniref:hypothetical protein n=1 Tax=Klebsiella TaxID=570 RepID=UPI00114CD472|nr:MULTISPECIES: hypothetical protein [Klebsiella]HCB0355802.1 hypothetical protein [Klebsiella variicola subsp. variicola]